MLKRKNSLQERTPSFLSIDTDGRVVRFDSLSKVLRFDLIFFFFPFIVSLFLKISFIIKFRNSSRLCNRPSCAHRTNFVPYASLSSSCFISVSGTVVHERVLQEKNNLKNTKTKGSSVRTAKTMGTGRILGAR